MTDGAGTNVAERAVNGSPPACQLSSGEADEQRFCLTRARAQGALGLSGIRRAFKRPILHKSIRHHLSVIDETHNAVIDEIALGGTSGNQELTAQISAGGARVFRSEKGCTKDAAAAAAAGIRRPAGPGGSAVTVLDHDVSAVDISEAVSRFVGEESVGTASVSAGGNAFSSSRVHNSRPSLVLTRGMHPANVSSSDPTSTALFQSWQVSNFMNSFRIAPNGRIKPAQGSVDGASAVHRRRLGSRASTS